MTTRLSVLDPPPQSLFLPLVLAVLMHGCAGGALVAVDLLADLFSGPSRPIVDIEDTVEVSLVQLKHSDKMPTRATVAPVPQVIEPSPTPAPAEPTPPNPSDLAFRDPEVKPKPQGLPDRSKDREKLLQELERQRLLRDALEGAKTREATDPDSTASETITTGTTTGRISDPELARWKASVDKFWADAFSTQDVTTRRIAAANPNIKAEYNIRFDPETGRVLSFEPYKPSGNPSYDAAVERTIQATSTTPVPPAKFRELVGTTLTVTFLPP